MKSKYKSQHFTAMLESVLLTSRNTLISEIDAVDFGKYNKRFQFSADDTLAGKIRIKFQTNSQRETSPLLPKSRFEIWAEYKGKPFHVDVSCQKLIPSRTTCQVVVYSKKDKKKAEHQYFVGEDGVMKLQEPTPA